MSPGVRASALALGALAFASLSPLAASAATVHHPAHAVHGAHAVYGRTAHVHGRLTPIMAPAATRMPVRIATPMAMATIPAPPPRRA